VGKGKTAKDGKLIKPMSRRVIVSFCQVFGHEVKMDGVEHLIMREDDILGIIEK